MKTKQTLTTEEVVSKLFAEDFEVSKKWNLIPTSAENLEWNIKFIHKDI